MGPTVHGIRALLQPAQVEKVFGVNGEYLTATNCSLYGGTVGVHNGRRK